MHVFQRTPSWVIEKPDSEITARTHEMFRKKPYLQKFMRGAIYWALEMTALGYVVEPRLNRLRERAALRYLHESVKDPELRRKLTPQFRLGCKRILISNDYYATLERPNVELVTDAIAEIREHSIVTKDGQEREVDTIICATGFETAEAKPPFAIVGRSGFDLREAWRDGIEAYLGTTMAGFPNLFLLVGPNMGLGHSSLILMMESQYAYVLDAIRTMRKSRLKLVDVRRDVEVRYNERLQKRLAHTVWNSGGCASWYLTRSGKNTTTWPGFTFEFRLKTRRFDVKNYETCLDDQTQTPVYRSTAPESLPPTNERGEPVTTPPPAEPVSTTFVA
jgi:cation diffusion facilitator CzcD-associated flavoprotein CzcO